MPNLDQGPRVQITSLGGHCPVQAEGTIDEQPFYFRARHDAWSLEIGQPTSPAYVLYEQPVGDPGTEEAGWMDDETARRHILECARAYHNEMDLFDHAQGSRLSEERTAESERAFWKRVLLLQGAQGERAGLDPKERLERLIAGARAPLDLQPEETVEALQRKLFGATLDELPEDHP